MAPVALTRSRVARPANGLYAHAMGMLSSKAQATVPSKTRLPVMGETLTARA
jgi:hypothetical protein